MRSSGVVALSVCLLLAQAGCGQVAASCPPGIDLQTSHDHCGACGRACGAEEACSSGTCAACAAGQTLCNDRCAATDLDAANCGGCGMSCNTGEVCGAGQCQVPCDATKLTQPSIVDPWGVIWDRLARDAATFSAASAACEVFGGRLPTPSELYRVSATQSGAVGSSIDTEYLWTPAPDDKLDQAVLRLSDAGTSTSAASAALKYRCVCAPVKPRMFTTGHCYGAPGAPCFTAGGRNYDTADRPALRQSAALWECINERAHLADLPALVEAIQAGLPGSNQYLSTADASSNHQSTELRWTAGTWVLPGNFKASTDFRTPAPFRCVAPGVAVSPNPNSIANEFVGTLSPYKGETVDSPTAAWAAAHDACTARGGHLPRSAELAELIMQGLPGGSGKALWSSDQTGYDGTQFLVAVNSWTAREQRYSYAFGGTDPTVTWAYKTATEPFRCIYYPIDTAYQDPAGCMGGCFKLALPGHPAPTMWLDSVDRPTSTLTAAFADCAAAGGHLASERDLAEAIRAGLPNDPKAGTYVYTSDFGQAMAMMVRWTGATTGKYTDLYPADMSWGDTATLRPHRCLWTNELR